MEQAEAGLDRIRTAYANVIHRLEHSADLGDQDDMWTYKINEQIKAFETAMDDDFNTANAIAELFEIAKQANIYLKQNQTSISVLTAYATALEKFMGVLGLKLSAEKELLDEEIDALIEERNAARKERNFARADEIRDQLKEMNIILEDTAQGVRWKRG